MRFHSDRLKAMVLAAICCVALPAVAAGPMSDSGILRMIKDRIKLNVYLHPNSANTYDSLALAYEKNGDIALAIANYRKALEMEPNNWSLDAHERLKALAPHNSEMSKRDTAGK